MYLLCGHKSASDTEPICPICPTKFWDGGDPLPCMQFSPNGPPEGKFICVVCNEVADHPSYLPECHTEGNNFHYCGCRDRLFNTFLREL